MRSIKINAVPIRVTIRAYKVYKVTRLSRANSCPLRIAASIRARCLVVQRAQEDSSCYASSKHRSECAERLCSEDMQHDRNPTPPHISQKHLRTTSCYKCPEQARQPLKTLAGSNSGSRLHPVDCLLLERLI